MVSPDRRASGPVVAKRPVVSAVTERLKRSDLRELLLQHAVDLLLDEGLEVGLDRLTFPKVFDRVELATGRRITRASVYDRLWVNQQEFQWHALARLIESTSVMDPRTERRIDEVLATADRSTERGRWSALGMLCLVAVERYVVESGERQHNRIVLAAVGAIASSRVDKDPDDHVRLVQEALVDYLDRETAMFVDLYNRIGWYLGFRMRDPFELRHLVLAIGALGEGVALRLNYFDEYAGRIPVPADADFPGAAQWSLSSIGVEAIARRMLELDPDWHPSRTLP